MADLGNDIQRYLKGEMSSAEMHALEKKALNDPFLADALEGGYDFPDVFAGDVDALKDSISSKTKRGRPSIPWYYKAAAAVLLMSVSAILIYYLSGREQAFTPITMNQQEGQPAQENFTPPADTVSPASTASETVPDEAEEKNPEPLRSQPVEEPGVSARKKIDESSADTRVSEKAEIASQPSLSDQSPGSDSLQARSFAIRRDATKETAGIAAAPAKIRVPVSGGRQTVRGKVTDIDDGLPLPGVNVIAKGTTVGTVTDLNGNFELQVSDSVENLVFSFIGLQTREVDVQPVAGGTSEVNVQLEPDVASLSEVVVVGYGTESEFEFEGTEWEPAEPAGGKRAFKRYLESNLRYPEVAIENNVEGKVTIQFTIEPTGTLTDFRIVRSLGYGCDEEVIRLIKNGPQWKPTKRNDEPVRGKGKVKMRFALPK